MSKRFVPCGATRPRVVVTGRTATLVAVSAALGATVLGLLGLGASAVGVPGVRVPALALLVIAGLMAAVIRGHRRGADKDAEAFLYLEMAQVELERGDPTTSHAMASRALRASGTSGTRNRARAALAWAALGQGYPERAKAVLDGIDPPYEVDIHCLAAVEAARGRTKFAIQALELAWASGGLTREGAKLLVDCHLRAFGMERAVVVAIVTSNILGGDNCEIIVNAARVAGSHAAAAELAAVLRGDADTRPPRSLSLAPVIDPTAPRHR